MDTLTNNKTTSFTTSQNLILSGKNQKIAVAFHNDGPQTLQSMAVIAEQLVLFCARNFDAPDGFRKQINGI